MSIFSHIRKSRQQAKEHTAKVAEQEKKEQQQKVPYKHVPTHAATDAFASAPPSWRELDRPRILEENRRRSAMAASGHHMNMPGAPRVGSGLSHVTYPGEDATPMVRRPRPNSYTGAWPCVDGGREAIYPVPHISCSRPMSLKGKEVIGRWSACDSQRASPTPSKGEPSPVESSSGSTESVSQDDLEMAPTRQCVRLADPPHRLHPSHRRRASDASLERLAPGRSGMGSHVRDSRPPPSMRGFASIAQVAAPLPAHVSLNHPPTSQTPVAGRRYDQGSSYDTLTPRHSSTCSLPSLTPTSSRLPASGPGTPRSLAVSRAEDSPSWALDSHAELDKPRLPEGLGEANGTTYKKRLDRGMTQSTGTSELAKPVGIQSSHEDVSRADRGRKPAPLAHEDIVNVFPEQLSLPSPSDSSSKKRLVKGGGKMVKKSRWSGSKTSAVVV